MSRDDTPADDKAVVPYAVGYGKPPAERRFKTGKSGNPRGRPRGNKNPRRSPLSAERANDFLLEEAYRPIVLREGDRVIELPAIQAVFRAMGVAAMKGNRFAQKTLAELVVKVEAERTEAMTQHLGRMIEYKVQWEREIERCRTARLPIPEPLPHPDDILIDARSCTVRVAGPVTREEKAWFDRTVTLMKMLQVQVSFYAAATRRARSQTRRDSHLSELHDYQRQFDQMNDMLPRRYQVDLSDRSDHPDASKPGDYAKKMGIELPGFPPPKALPDELLQLLL